ncbi:hypothetical protein WJX72_001060 [[Myrmecia] bisecta]|uniref:Uncharacterized protein n=1 Tax=[Myrmecia] bisecta TaxID=41462 RepID=A0AAW1PXK3_9CHLO
MDGPRLRQTGPDPRAGQKGRVDGAAAGVDPLDPLDSLEPDGEGDGMQTLHAYDPLSVVDALKQAREADFEHLQEHAEEEAVIAEAEYKRQEQLRKEQRKKELEAKRQKKERMREKAERKAREAAAAEEMRIKSEAMLADKARLDAYYATPEFQEQRAANWDRAGRPGRTRGIVIPSGGSVLLHHAFVTIKMLREVHNCTLPIQIIYNGPNEMGPKKIAKFQNAFSDVTCIDGSKVPYPKHHRRIDLGTRKSEDSVDDESHKDVSGFAFKIWALVYATTFDEVLMLDSDNMPLREPSYLFETREYRMHGALFFPDWWEKGWVKAEAYTMFGLEVPWTLKPKYVTSESGQLLLDRNQHFDVLEWLWFLNSHQNVTYKLMYGDKDTFRLAFNLAGKKRDFKQVTIPPCAPLDANPLNKPPTVFLHVGMMQHDPYGNVAFLHRTAEGKFYAFGKGFRKVDYVSVPLSPKRAKGCLHKTMGYSAKQIDTGTFAQCPVADPKTFHKECKLNIRSPDFPIPVIPVGEIPELSGVLEASNAMFRQIQKEYKDSLLADRERLSRRHMLA